MNISIALLVGVRTSHPRDLTPSTLPSYIENGIPFIGDLGVKYRWLNSSQQETVDFTGEQLLESVCLNGVAETCAWAFAQELIALATKGENPFTKALVEGLLSKGADPSACCDSFGRSALHAASTKDNGVAAVALIRAGAYVDKMDDQGQTPLHLAAIRNAPRVAQVLVDAGAKINVKDDDGETPLHDAAERGHWKVAEILLKAGANRFMVDSKGRTPRDSVCSNGCGRSKQEKKLNDLFES